MAKFIPFMGMVSLSLVLAGCNQEASKKAIDEAAKTASEAVQSTQEAAGEAVATAKEGLSSLMDQATAAVTNVEGGSELLKSVTGLFASAKESLQGIQDSATAEAAAAKLTELGGSAENISQLFGKLPDEAKKALVGLIQGSQAELKVIIDKVMAIPGVETIIKPKLDELMAKLNALQA